MVVGCILAISGVMFMFRSSAATIADTDLNGDGVVNLTDMSMLLSNFNTANTVGDIDHNGTVNLTDLSMLLTNYGKSVPTTPPPTPPPPTTPPPTTPPPTTPPPTTPPPVPNGSVTGPITNPTSDNRCIDVENGTASSSAAIRMWDCNGAPAQQWTIAFTDDGTVEIKALGMCLTAPQTTITIGNFVPLNLQTCNGSAYSKWMISKSTVSATHITNKGLTDYNNGGYACLTLDGDGEGSTGAGTLVRAYLCITESNANFWTPPTNSPTAGISAFGFTSNTSKCLDLPSGATTAGTGLQVWDCNQLAPQRFTLGTDTPNNRSKLIVLDQCVEVKDGGTADGTPVQIGTCANKTSQDWEATKANGIYTFKNPASGKCLDTATGAVANSVGMVIKTCGSAAGQQFTAQ